MPQTLLTHCTLATLTANGAPYGLIENAALEIAGDTIVWCGKAAERPTPYEEGDRIDLGGRLVTPGLIDCHTHIIHGGERSAEFEMRLLGASYEDIARSGGGILSTVKATRALSISEMVETAGPRIDRLMAEGVTSIEIKSGYGLDLETELNMLRAARKIEAECRIRVRTSFLGAHAIPPDYKDRSDAYIDEVCIPALEAAYEESLVDAVDGYCESIAFTPAQIERVFETATALGLPVKLHAGQLSNLGGAKLAAGYKALSADHLEYIDAEGVAALAEAGSVATILPGAYYMLGETQAPPIEQFREAGVPMAVATDCNPGSSPMTSLLLAMNMACVLFGMTPEEALAGTTRNAARALGLHDVGSIAPGLRADLAIWNVNHPRQLSYNIGFNPLHKRIFGGEL